MSPGGFTPEPVALSSVLLSISPPLWVLGGGSGLRREHKDAPRSLQSRREDKGIEHSNITTVGGKVLLVSGEECEVPSCWRRLGRPFQRRWHLMKSRMYVKRTMPQGEVVYLSNARLD